MDVRRPSKSVFTEMLPACNPQPIAIPAPQYTTPKARIIPSQKNTKRSRGQLASTSSHPDQDQVLKVCARVICLVDGLNSGSSIFSTGPPFSIQSAMPPT